ncbi:hypothetical protein THTE_4031 [Thermogutta terrifontis]|uniref:Uncharacterized protein n=1 Tax=Thermogutta terrifontis TaxID=1331910 RepID=A0A286RL12_9BACT|nr:hypothetical protein THTE_4031 [Thermogutta terrifontis]
MPSNGNRPGSRAAPFLAIPWTLTVVWDWQGETLAADGKSAPHPAWNMTLQNVCYIPLESSDS